METSEDTSNIKKPDESLNAARQVNSNVIGVTNCTQELESTSEKCPACHAKDMAKNEPAYIYAIGSIRIDFTTNASLRNEFIQAMTQEKTQKMSDQQALYQVIKKNRHIAREACWVFSVEKVDCYILMINDPFDLEQLVETINPDVENKGEDIDVDVIIGQRGPIAPLAMCGLALPIVMVDKIYSFAKKELIEAIPKPENVDTKSFRDSSRELFERIQQLADNVGATDSHRALNYIAVRYPQIYVHTNHMHRENYSLSSVEVIPSRLSKVNKLVDVLLTNVHRTTQEIRKFYLRVDVTGKYPYLQSPLTQFFDRT